VIRKSSSYVDTDLRYSMECNSVTLIHIKIEEISSREMGIFREYV
jgi:hypothetical protein